MSKAKAVVSVPSYKSISDFGYNVAKRAESFRADGAWALDNIAGFPDDIQSEARSELNVGFRQRASELPSYAETEYAMVDGNLLPVSQLSGDIPAERYRINVAVAFSYTQQQIGAMKADEPAKYAILKDLRERVNKYCSNCLADLKSAAKRVQKQRNPESTSRAATLSFGEFVEKTLDGLKTRCKSAEARGNDPSANMKALDAAIIAFKVKLEVTK